MEVISISVSINEDELIENGIIELMPIVQRFYYPEVRFEIDDPALEKEYPDALLMFQATPGSEERTYILDIYDLQSAFNDILAGYGDIAHYIRTYFFQAAAENDWGYIDEEAADVWLQMAAFGRIVFG